MIVLMKFQKCYKINFGNIIKLVNFTNFKFILMRPVIYQLFNHYAFYRIPLILVLATGHKIVAELQNLPKTDLFSFSWQ